MIWIILPEVQKLCYLKIQLLITYPMSSIFAKLGISNVGMTDNGPSECSFFTTYCNCLHFCLGAVYPVFNEELKTVLSSFNVSVRWWFMFRFRIFPVLSILLKIQISFGHCLTDPRKSWLTSAELLFSKRLKTTQIYRHYHKKETIERKIKYHLLN